MNAIWLAVFLSGMLNDPDVLKCEQDYIREYASQVTWNDQRIEVRIEKGYNHSGLEFLLEDEFGRRGDYIMDWIDQQHMDWQSNPHLKDYEVVELTVDGRLVALKKANGAMLLSYERSKG